MLRKRFQNSPVPRKRPASRKTESRLYARSSSTPSSAFKQQSPSGFERITGYTEVDARDGTTQCKRVHLDLVIYRLCNICINADTQNNRIGSRKSVINDRVDGAIPKADKDQGGVTIAIKYKLDPGNPRRPGV
jgi:hypothetical protein